MWTSITPTYWKDVDRRSSSSFLLCECVFSPFWRFGPQSKDEDWVSWTCVLTPSFCCGEITQPCLHLYLSNLQVTRPFFSLRQLVFHVSINWCPNVSCSFHLCWVNYDYEWMRYGRLYTSDNNTDVMLRLSREDNLVELYLWGGPIESDVLETSDKLDKKPYFKIWPLQWTNLTFWRIRRFAHIRSGNAKRRLKRQQLKIESYDTDKMTDKTSDLSDVSKTSDSLGPPHYFS